MQCRNCGRNWNDQAKFCPECGAPLRGQAGNPMQGKPKKSLTALWVVLGTLGGVFLLCILVIYLTEGMEAKSKPAQGSTVVSDSAKDTEENRSGGGTKIKDTEKGGGLFQNIRPEFQEAMDSYEAFYDEYCDVLQEYYQNPTSLEILSRYMDLLEKVADMDAKFEAWNEEEMSDAEEAYWLEVNIRIEKKLLGMMQTGLTGISGTAGTSGTTGTAGIAGTSGERTQKDGFEDHTEITIGDYRFSIPTYWEADITKEDRYRAYAETSGKTAMLEIDSVYDSFDPVTYEILADETEKGLMSKSLKSGFDSAGEVIVEPFDNGNVQGFTYQIAFTQQGLQGEALYLCFPDVKNNRWFYVSLAESDNTDYDYMDDFHKILDSICLK